MTSVLRLRQKQAEFPKLPNAHALLAKAKSEFGKLPKTHIAAGAIPVQEKRRP